MPTSVEIKIVLFGQVKLEVGKSIPAVEERQAFPTRKAVRYQEPQETISRIYEVEYRELLTNYIVPLSTG